MGSSQRVSGELGQNLSHNIPMHIRQPEIASLEAIRQPRVLDPKTLENRRVQVVNVHRIAGDVVAVIVRLAELDAWANAAAGHPEREAAAVMVAAVIRRGERALAVDGAAELAAPDDECIVEQAALLEVADEGGGRLIDIAALAAD